MENCGKVIRLKNVEFCALRAAAEFLAENDLSEN